MKGKEYAQKNYPVSPSYRVIAEKAFDAGVDAAQKSQPYVDSMRKQIGKLKQQVKDLKTTIKTYEDNPLLLME